MREAVDELVPGAKTRSDALSLSLVPMEVMDTKVAFGALCRPFDIAHAEALASLCVRIGLLLGRDLLRPGQNPFRPEVFLTAIHDAWRAFAPDQDDHALLLPHAASRALPRPGAAVRGHSTPACAHAASRRASASTSARPWTPAARASRAWTRRWRSSCAACSATRRGRAPVRWCRTCRTCRRARAGVRVPRRDSAWRLPASAVRRAHGAGGERCAGAGGRHAPSRFRCRAWRRLGPGARVCRAGGQPGQWTGARKRP